MADQLAFVQFPHPGGEHGPDAEGGTLKRWEIDTNDHARKFIVAPGAWRDDPDASIEEGEIVFWGEWEAASTVASLAGRVTSGPHWIHRPFYEGLKDAPTDATRQNTDPFVFGEQFLYTYCRQRGNRKLRELAIGSLILFGSKKGKSFVLDSVLVVGESVAHTSSDYVETAAARVNHVFRETTLDPMYQQGKKGCRLYLGATAEHPTNGIFSFVPCLPAQEQRTFARPPIDLPVPLIKVGRTQQAGTTAVGDAWELRELWHRVVAQVLEHGCALGVRVDVPGARNHEPLLRPGSSTDRRPAGRASRPVNRTSMTCT